MQKSKMKLVVVIAALVLVGSALSGSIERVAAGPYVSYDSHKRTWTILPTGVDDTANIQYAFDNAAPGDTVYLAAGQFYCTHIDVEGFCGTFKGAGMTATSIDVIPGGPVIYDYYDVQWCYFFRFENGDFRISDMQFAITPEDPVDPWYFFGWYTYLGDVLFVTGDDVNAHIERVRFEGQGEEWADLNVGVAINYWSVDIFAYVSGSLTVSHCVFDNVEYAVVCERVADSDISISHNSVNKGIYGVFLADCPNCQILVKSNMFSDVFWCAMWSTGADNAVFKNNHVKGSGGLAVIIGGSLVSTGCLVLGNNFEHFDAGWFDIYLGPATSHCTVILGSADSIVNLGTDNVILGGTP
jgi:hypothetical protein